MKKTLALILALAMVFGLCACGVNVTTTNTTTTKNADGTSTTTTTKEENGVTTTTTTTSQTMGQICEDGEDHDFVLVIENKSDVDLPELYLTAADESEYENILYDGVIIEAGGETKIELTTNKDTLVFDFGILPEGSDDAIWFMGADLSEFDADNSTIEFALEDDGWHMYY